MRIPSPVRWISCAALAACALLALRPAAVASVPAPGAAPNHLLGQTSPYLLQHLHNPVDWYPWGGEALGRARREGKPIFLSIGYSACHWCHVMEREAFSDPQIARFLNEHFVSIKVDREERPDLDEIYMTAVLALTGRGGWPMSVFLTPDLKPFFGGTYFPRERFGDLLRGIQDAWTGKRGEIEATAARVTQAIAARHSSPAPVSREVSWAALLKAAVPRLRATFDAVHGGFGGAPKFPPHGSLALLLRAHEEHADPGALDMAVRTLDAMARGGIHDQIGGGFHRYSTDARWFAPHFEKMLYDNAQIVPLYLDAWRLSGREDFRRVAEDTLAWVRREMTAPGGGFHATLDADSEGEEGKYYLWTAAEIRAAAGARDAELVLAGFGATGPGNFESGRNILHQPASLESFASARGMTAPAVRARIEAARVRLLAARDRRVRPHLDDKILAGWNGLMISAFARAHGATGLPGHRDAAAAASRFVLDNLGSPDGSLRVSWRQGRAGGPAYLDDYAFMARGLLDLHEATGDRRWVGPANRIVRAAERFLDSDGGGYFLTASEHRDLIVRPKRLEDHALPSGNAVLAECQMRLARLLDEPALRLAARGILDLAGPDLENSPSAHATLILAAQQPAPREAAGRIRGDSGGAPVVTAAMRSGPAEAGALGAPAPPATPAAEPSELVLKGTIVGRPNPQRVVESSLVAPARPVRAGQTLTLSLRIEIAPGWHVNSSKPSLDYLIPTRVLFVEPHRVWVDDIAYPPGHLVPLKFANEKLSVYEGTTVVRATIRPTPGGPAGTRDTRVRLTYQACSDTTCLAPETVEFAVPIRVAGDPVPGAAPPVAPSVGQGAAGQERAGPDVSERGEGATGGGSGADIARLREEKGLLVLLGVVFLGGLALNLTPCVYPVVPVTIGFFAGQASASWGRRVTLPSLYVLGMAITYSTLGVVAGLSGGLLGSALQNPWIVGGLVLLFVAMAFWMFGAFELRLPAWATSVGGGRRGAAGALVMGLTMGLVAAPCIGPFVVGLLAFVGATGDPWLGFWLFFVMAIGLGLPTLLLGIFSGALASLPRSGVWLIYAKKIMGVALLGVALYFAQPLLADRTLGWAGLILAAGAGIYLAFLERTLAGARRSLPVRLGAGLAVALVGAWLSLPLVQVRTALEWTPYDHTTFARASVEGRPLIINFSADWCLPCRELERFTFTDRRVIEEASRFRLLKADLTQFESRPVREIRDRFDVIGVPTLVFIEGGGEERLDLHLFGYEPPEAFLERIRQVR